MATTPQGDDHDVRRSVMGALARAVARQRLATGGAKHRKLTGVYSKATAPRTVKK